MQQLSLHLAENLAELDARFGASADYYAKEIMIYHCRGCIVLFDGMASLDSLWELLLDAASRQALQQPCPCTGQEVYEHILHGSASPAESTPVEDLPDLVKRLTAGMAVLLLDGCAKGIAFSVQALKYRSVDEPEGEGNLRGSREGFADLLRVNLSLLRRLVRTDDLVLEVAQADTAAGTEYAICYCRGKADPAMVRQVRQSLAAAKPELLDFLAGEPEAENDPFADQPTKTAPELPELTPAQELAGYIRSRSAAALVTPHALLVSEVENADELLAQMPQDPQCEDIVVRAGAKDTYYYSNANMSDNYAMIAQLIEDKDLCVMFAEMVRFNARIYPSATPLKYFQRSPYGLAPEVVEQTWKAMQENPEYADIEELTNNQNERFLFSTKHLTRRYAKAISDVDDFCD